MPLRSFATKPERTAVLTKRVRIHGIDIPGKLNFLCIGLLLQRSQNTIGSKWRLAQADAHRVIDGIGNRGNARRKRTLASLLCPERTFGIDNLDDVSLNLR